MISILTHVFLPVPPDVLTGSFGSYHRAAAQATAKQNRRDTVGIVIAAVVNLNRLVRRIVPVDFAAIISVNFMKIPKVVRLTVVRYRTALKTSTTVIPELTAVTIRTVLMAVFGRLMVARQGA
jgi:hypothetical protein